ncbi:unnamed protein product [Durusdinium trenchii]|uniref:Uncharacterized protein n=1 Tax=Durusdinium trenchii TaxID=1381693 RepID=A0ABP0I7W0_9DINO
MGEAGPQRAQLPQAPRPRGRRGFAGEPKAPEAPAMGVLRLAGAYELQLLSKQMCQVSADELRTELQLLQARHPSTCISVGSLGHPETCRWPCRFMKRAAGCVHGISCGRCHLCTWSKSSLKMEARWKHQQRSRLRFVGIHRAPGALRLGVSLHEASPGLPPQGCVPPMPSLHLVKGHLEDGSCSKAPAADAPSTHRLHPCHRACLCCAR